MEDQADLIARMIAAPGIDEALAVLDSARGPTEPLLRQAFEAADHRLQSHVSEARRLLEVCLARAEVAAAPDLAPASWYLLARLSVNEGDTAAALERIQTARRCWLELGRPIDAYRTDLGRMHVLDDQGRHAEAIATGKRLLADIDGAAVETDDDAALGSWIRAATLENLGIAFGLTGQHDKALESYAAAEAIHQARGQVADEARLQGNRGVALIALGQPREALDALESAAALFIGLDDRLSFAMCSSNAAEANLLLGRYAASLDHFEQARPIFEEQGAWPELCRIQIRAVRAYLALGLAEEADALAETVCLRLEDLHLAHDLAEAVGLRAAVKLRVGDHIGALELANRSVTGAEAVGSPQLQTRGLLTVSQILRASGDHDAAAGAAEQALALASAGGWPTEDLAANLQMGLLCPDPVEREAHLERARVLADELQLPHLRYPVLLELGRFHREQGRAEPARRWFRAAVDEVEGLRWLIPNDTYRLSFFADRTSAHSELIELLVRTDDPGDHQLAYLLAEASKARALGDIIAGGGPGSDSRVGAAPSAVRDAIGADEGHVDREQLPGRHEQMVEYHVAGDRLVAFVWHQGQLHCVRPLPSLAEVSELVRSWEVQRRRWQLHNGLADRHAEQLRTSAERALAALGTAVFEPVARLLDSSQDELLVVPHGPLHLVPFHALMDGEGPVVHRWTITLAASYSIAAAMARRPPRPPGRRALVLSVADPTVPAAVEEGAAVAATFPDAVLLTGATATVTALRELGPKFDVLHLACHGRHRPGSPMFSSLQLADRSITAGEVLGLDLNRPLVVLSACESGRQSGQGQLDEAIGFARSFVAAGAEAVVVSLWLAHDAITRDLMTELYRALGQGLAPAAALRRAQTQLATRFPHPADWAPFVIHSAAPAL